MNTKIKNSTHNHHSIAERFHQLFQGRCDAWGALEGKSIKSRVDVDNYLKHLKGEVSLGIYPLLDNGKCKFVVIDFDLGKSNNSKQLAEEHSKSFARELVNLGLKPIWFERSKSGLIHLWLFFSEFIEAKKIREILNSVANKLDINIRNGEVEIFPKQDSLSKGGIGNYIHLPYYEYFKDKDITTRVIFDINNGNSIPIENFLEQAINSLIDPDAIDKAYDSIAKDKSTLLANKLNGSNTIKSKIVDIMVKYWDRGRRQDLAMYLSAFLYKNELKESEITEIIEDIAEKTHDEEKEQRVNAVKATIRKAINEQDTKGYKGLEQILSDEDLNSLQLATTKFINDKNKHLPKNKVKSNSLDQNHKQMIVGLIVNSKYIELFHDQDNETYVKINFEK